MTVLIPALDEEQALPHVLAALPASVHRCVVVDNGSRDQTAQVARAGGADVVSEPRRGYGSACLAGLTHIAGEMRDDDVVVFLDADHSDDPSLVPRVAAPVLSGHSDLVLGCRREGVPLHARAGNALVLSVVRVLYGRRFADVPPFRAVRWSALRALDMDDRDFGWTLQMQLRALKKGLRIHEQSVPYRPRVAGESKVSGSLRGSVGAGRKMLSTVWMERFRS